MPPKKPRSMHSRLGRADEQRQKKDRNNLKSGRQVSPNDLKESLLPKFKAKEFSKDDRILLHSDDRAKPLLNRTEHGFAPDRPEGRDLSTPSSLNRLPEDALAFYHEGEKTAKRRGYQSLHDVRPQSMKIIVAFLLALGVLLSGGLFQTQILRHDELSKAVSEQYYSHKISEPKRGEILDRNQQKIAGTHYVYRVGVSPAYVRSNSNNPANMVPEEQIAVELAAFMGLDAQFVAQILAQKEQSYYQFAVELDEERGTALEKYLNEHKINGVRLDAEARRYYLNENLASQVVGFAGHNEQGLVGRLGLELQYDSELSGSPSYNYGARDNYLNQGLLPFADSEQQNGQDGLSLRTTLDMRIQSILQEELESAVKAYAATEQGMGIILDPYTGEVLGMASYPYFQSANPMACPAGQDPATWHPDQNPEQAKFLGDLVWRNRCISEDYEAGSTMKTITAAIGLQEAKTTEKTPYSDSPLQVLDYTISCVSGDGHGVESMEEGFWRSCNPVFVQIAQAVGIDRFYSYMQAFGFREPTGIDLPAEITGVFHRDPSVIDLATLSFGEQSTITPIQLMQAYGALVNGGYIIRPHVVKALQNAEGQVVKSFEPEILRQVISSETSARCRELMRGMVKFTEHLTNETGYRMGGKTSTSTDEATGFNTISFMCAAPIDQPEVLCMIILKRPQDEHLTSTDILLRVVQTTARVLEHLNVDRHYSDEDQYKLSQKQVAMPEFRGMSLTQAARTVSLSSINVIAVDEKTDSNTLLSGQSPAEGTILFPGQNVYVWSEGMPEIRGKVPDFTGMNISECIHAANDAKLVVNFSGDLSGNAVGQSLAETAAEALAPGTELPLGSVVNVALNLN